MSIPDLPSTSLSPIPPQNVYPPPQNLYPQPCQNVNPLKRWDPYQLFITSLLQRWDLLVVQSNFLQRWDPCYLIFQLEACYAGTFSMFQLKLLQRWDPSLVVQPNLLQRWDPCYLIIILEGPTFLSLLLMPKPQGGAAGSHVGSNAS